MSKPDEANGNSTELDAVVAEIRRAFLARLAGNVDQLLAIRQNLLPAHCEEDIAAVVFIAHRIRGLAATVGFSRLGGIAEQLEVTINERRAMPGGISGVDIFSELDLLIAEMKTVCAIGSS